MSFIMTKSRKPRDPNKPKSSQYRGVSLSSMTHKYVAQFKHMGKTKYLGIFNDEVTAAKVYDQAIYAEMQNGIQPFMPARLNFGIPTSPLNLKLVKEEHRYKQPIKTVNPVQPTDLKQYSTPYAGVSWYAQRQLWKASYQFNNQKYYLGRYNIAEDAARAYNQSLKALAENQQDPIIKKRLINRVYEVPDTETRYPANYVKKTKLTRVDVESPAATGATTTTTTALAAEQVFTQQQLEIPTDFDFFADLSPVQLYDDPLRTQTPSPLLFRAEARELLFQDLDIDDEIFRTENDPTSSLRF